MSRMMRMRALGTATLAAGALLLGVSAGDAQSFNQPLNRPPMPAGNAPLSVGQQLQLQSYSNALQNRARAEQDLGGAANVGSTMRTERQLNTLQLQQIQRQ